MDNVALRKAEKPLWTSIFVVMAFGVFFIATSNHEAAGSLDVDLEKFCETVDEVNVQGDAANEEQAKILLETAPNEISGDVAILIKALGESSDPVVEEAAVTVNRFIADSCNPEDSDRNSDRDPVQIEFEDDKRNPFDRPVEEDNVTDEDDDNVSERDRGTERDRRGSSSPGSESTAPVNKTPSTTPSGSLGSIIDNDPDDTPGNPGTPTNPSPHPTHGPVKETVGNVSETVDKTLNDVLKTDGTVVEDVTKTLDPVVDVVDDVVEQLPIVNDVVGTVSDVVGGLTETLKREEGLLGNGGLLGLGL